MIGQSVGKSFAYLIGVYLGDGCVTKSGNYAVFRLNTIDPDFALATKAALNELGCRWCSLSMHSVSKSSKPNRSLAARHDDLCCRLVSVTDGKKHLPNMEGWSRDEKLAFVAGLMDSEGFVGRIKRRERARVSNRDFYMGFKSCDPWIPEFARLLESLGIMVGKIGAEAPRKPGYKTPQRFTIKMQSWIDAGAYFNIERKASRVREWASFGAYQKRSRYPRRLTSETTRETL